MTVHESTWSQSGPEPRLQHVLSRFGIDPSSIESIGPLLAGAGRHAGFRVRADNLDWALKRHTSAPMVERLKRSHLLELRLGEAGFPVAQLCRSVSGETLVEDGVAHYSLHRWVVGQQVTIADRDELLVRRPALVSDFGVMIGTLHRLSREFDADEDDVAIADPDRLLKVPRSSMKVIQRPSRLLLSRWQALRLKPRKSPFDRWILQVLPEVATRADWLAKESVANRVDRSGMGLVHNDVNWENLVFDEHFAVRAVLDFDNASRVPWALEVGACAVVLVGADPRKVEEFLCAYEGTSGVGVDRELVRLGMEAKCVRSILTSVLAHFKGGYETALLMPWCHHLHQSLQALRR